MPKPKDGRTPMGHGTVRTIHSTPGGWDPTSYYHAEELGRTAKSGGMKGGLGDHKMNHQPSHKRPPQKTKVNPNAQPPDYLNVSPKPLPPVNPEIEKIIEADLEKRNIRVKPKSKPRKPKTKD